MTPKGVKGRTVRHLAENRFLCANQPFNRKHGLSYGHLCSSDYMRAFQELMSSFSEEI